MVTLEQCTASTGLGAERTVSGSDAIDQAPRATWQLSLEH